MQNDAIKPSRQTCVVQANHYKDELTGAIIPAIQPSVTFARNQAYNLPSTYLYARNASPTVAQAEEIITNLEQGYETRLFASGMAAITAVASLLAVNDRVCLPHTMYYLAQKLFQELAHKQGIIIDYYTPGDCESLAASVKAGFTKLVWVETPVNPSWEITDIAHAAATAQAAGAICCVDSTVASPVLTMPLTLGADIVFHSATKYLNGHSDVTAGSLTVAKSSPQWQQIKAQQPVFGATLGPFEAYLLIRGMRSLFLRVEKSSENAMRFAKHFATHPQVTNVLYPGLTTHPQHKLAAQQMRGGFGGMLSVLVKGGTTQAKLVTAGLKIFNPATSLGSVESLAEHRKSVEGENSKVAENLIRLSIGIEDVQDLIADFEQALAVVKELKTGELEN